MEDTVDTLTSELDSLREQVVVAKEELRVINAKRIESVGFMNELKYRESNLKRKYEALGLTYE